MNKTPINKRLQQTFVSIILQHGTIKDAMFQHSVLYQTFLPYRNPVNDVRIWQHRQGNAILAIQCQEQINPNTWDYQFLDLPYGAKARLILAYINSEAIRTQSPVVNVEKSMTAFIRKIGPGSDGRTIRKIW